MGASMIDALASFDPRTAAGILARMALVLDGGVDNPDARSTVPDEDAIRQRVLQELRSRFSLNDRDDDEALERLYQALDEESDRLLGPSELDPALERLSERAELPSDRYIVEITEDGRRLLNDIGLPFEREEQLIRLTVREPHAEQHYGPMVNEDRPSLVSLFARRLEHRYPHRDFILLVMGHREKTILKVWAAWRVYPAVVDLHGAATLVDMVSRFADHFGYPVRVGNRTGKFILSAQFPWNPTLETSLLEIYSPGPGGGETATILLEPHSRRLTLRTTGGQARHEIRTSMFFELSPQENSVKAAFVVAIDIEKYRRVLTRFGAIERRRANRA
jgi:hypothetical protein